MLQRKQIPALLAFLLFVVLAAAGQAGAQDGKSGPPAPPPPRAIPGITAQDPFPGGCVDCHVNHPERKMDVRLSTHMKEWNEKMDPKLLEEAQASSPKGLKLKGKHPTVTRAFRNIPAACMTCHRNASKVAPPFSRLLHVIHLTGGKENHYLTLFQGECTYCHKLNLTTGAWSMPSGPEK